MPPKTQKILVTGACGQIGTELVRVLRQRYGRDNVVATDIAEPSPGLKAAGPFDSLDVTRRADVAAAVDRRRIDTIYHMAAILSARGEQNPGLAWEVNINGTYNILEVGREKGLTRVFCPSSIAVFGPETPKEQTPQETILRPKTMYGLTKVAGELLGDYYVQKHGLDVRGCRYPGIISHETLPGGGTTDYAVAIFFEAVKHKRYTCFLGPETRLPMMYMPDCLKAMLDLMEADFGRLKRHCDFNLASMSFSAAELAAEIKKHIPEFVAEYRPDFRQVIADSWPRTIDDSAAREEWGWKPDFDLASMTADMLRAIREKAR
ncbi:MAG: UDP-glucose 4-epimerase [Candidatus Aminicenantes bacterium RBG_13_62_12]|nr:MAG: UDP-glucose 4-epimerase [Candidatus Aminicenantes bacterium RBG_13_62_12]